jgi:hypothetical protein
MSRFSSFLKTTTGMVTTVATLLVAVAGLIAAVKQLTGSQSSAGPAAATTVVSGDTPAERELRSHIPLEIRPSCGPPVNPEETAVASFNCTYRDVVKLQYNLFASDVELRDDVARVRKLYGDKHECGPKPLLCFEQSSGEADIVWVDEPASIMGFAYRDYGHLDALYESWRKIAE